MAGELGVSGSVDPTTLYTKQQCIGRSAYRARIGEILTSCYRRRQLWKGVQRVGAQASF